VDATALFPQYPFMIVRRLSRPSLSRHPPPKEATEATAWRAGFAEGALGGEDTPVGEDAAL